MAVVPLSWFFLWERHVSLKFNCWSELTTKNRVLVPKWWNVPPFLWTHFCPQKQNMVFGSFTWVVSYTSFVNMVNNTISLCLSFFMYKMRIITTYFYSCCEDKLVNMRCLPGIWSHSVNSSMIWGKCWWTLVIMLISKKSMYIFYISIWVIFTDI